MSLFSKKRRAISDEAMAKEQDLKIEVTIKVTTNEQYGQKTVADVNIQKSLVSTTDTKGKDLLAEVESVLGGALEAIEEGVDVSRYLSEGYHEVKRSENKSDF